MKEGLAALSIKKSLLVCFAVLVVGCAKKNENAQFKLLKSVQTGLDFANELEQTEALNVLNYMYFYNGGGLAAGDFNNDGLIDLYFTANIGSNKMFLNKGNLQFEDVTEKAAIQGLKGWTTGVSVVDINNDGMLDLYISQIGDYLSLQSTNQLYVCTGITDGIPTYENQARQYGLDLVGFSTQATFFDYDQDGDLDMFQLNHSLHQNGTFGQRKIFEGKIDPKSGDKLLRNDNGLYVDVTETSGIKSTVIGYGLGLVTGDINNDGWTDIYVGNDFHENDYLYINQQDGTFKELLTEQMMHTSRFSMGVDMGDINNDGQSEIVSLDMLPSDPVILKSSFGEDSYDIFEFKIRFGYNKQFSRNNLQLNNGNGSFSEIGLFSGMYATDWSWAPLFVDFDNDGYKDLFISNGIPRRMNDIDYVNYKLNSPEEQLKAKKGDPITKEDLKVVDRMPQIKIPNSFFANDGNLHFKEIGENIQNNADSYSNGAVYADLDNDGDLDIVVNNIDEEPFIYQNLSEKKPQKGNSLILKLKGAPNNKNAIGARLIVIKKDGQILSTENETVRGFQSSSLGPLVLGLGDSSQVKNTYLIWPDRSYQEISNPQFNHPMEMQWEPGLAQFDFSLIAAKNSTYHAEDITAETGLNFRHIENNFVDFNRETLIPYMVSREGPALAVGDVNGDGLDDIFFGNARNSKSALYLQNKEGKFTRNSSSFQSADSDYEDVDAVFQDVDNDNDLDLVVASGGNEFNNNSPFLRQQLYLNDGNGDYTLKPNAFPNAYLTASCVLATDFNQDGLIDFFFGGRSVPNAFGATPKSYLFINQGNGNFEDQTSQIAATLSEVGMVKGGKWADMDNDGDQDLVLAMDWDRVKMFRNENGKLLEFDISTTAGWWDFVEAGDFDEDGDIDLIVGNSGANNRLHPGIEHPTQLYWNDFDNDGKKEPIVTYTVNDREIPFASHAELSTLKKKYLYATDMANASINELFGKEKIKSAKLLSVNNSQSVLLINNGDGTFREENLPAKLQFSALKTAIYSDFDQNGTKEILLAGNFYGNNIEMGMYDADFGNILNINSNDKMNVSPLGSLSIRGEVRKAAKVIINGVPCYVLAKNNDTAQIIRFQEKHSK